MTQNNETSFLMNVILSLWCLDIENLNTFDSSSHRELIPQFYELWVNERERLFYVTSKEKNKMSEQSSSRDSKD